jgi:hypothetical protein
VECDVQRPAASRVDSQSSGARQAKYTGPLLEGFHADAFRMLYLQKDAEWISWYAVAMRSIWKFSQGGVVPDVIRRLKSERKSTLARKFMSLHTYHRVRIEMDD